MGVPNFMRPDNLTKLVTEFWYLNGLTFWDIKCSQIDAMFMYSFVHTLRPEFVLEIGRSKGSSTVILSKALQDIGAGHLHSIDIVDLVPEATKTFLVNNTTLHYGSSEFLVDKNLFNDIKFKLFFVDGDHSQAMVEKDIDTCIALAENEAYIMLHDNQFESVRTAIDNMLVEHTSLTRCGNFGTCISVLRVSKQ